MSEQKFFTPIEIAKNRILGYKSEVTIRRLIHSGKLKALDFSSGKRPTWHISLDSIREFIKERYKDRAYKLCNKIEGKKGKVYIK